MECLQRRNGKPNDAIEIHGFSYVISTKKKELAKLLIHIIYKGSVKFLQVLYHLFLAIDEFKNSKKRIMEKYAKWNQIAISCHLFC